MLSFSQNVLLKEHKVSNKERERRSQKEGETRHSIDRQDWPMDAFWAGSPKEQCFNIFRVLRLQNERAVLGTCSRDFPSQQAGLSLCPAVVPSTAMSSPSITMSLLKSQGNWQPSTAVASIRHEGKTPRFSSSVLIILVIKWAGYRLAAECVICTYMGRHIKNIRLKEKDRRRRFM